MKNTSGRILVVDPDMKTREELSALFVSEGYDVDTSRGITDTGEGFKYTKFDCVIMDVRLPELKGYEAVSILKAIDPKVQVIMTAAHNTMELEAKVREQDIFYYYIKSFDKEELKLAVHDVFKKLGKEVLSMHQPAKILIVDDDPDFVDATRNILESKSYEVEAAYNSKEAMEKIEKGKPDLILLDIMLEKLTDGFTICYKLKHHPELRHIPVFAISAITEKTGLELSIKTEGEYFEADDYMEKPVKPNDLLERIERLLKSKRKKQIR